MALTLLAKVGWFGLKKETPQERMTFLIQHGALQKVYIQVLLTLREQTPKDSLHLTQTATE
jgi:hypothetical protein